MIYADTSFLVSLILSDPNSAMASDMAARASEPIVFNDLLRLEVQNTIRLGISHGGLEEDSASVAADRAKSLEAKGIWKAVELDWSKVFARSRGLSMAWTSPLKLRSLDIIHVASAMELGVRDFWSFDNRQRSLAGEFGMRVNQ